MTFICCVLNPLRTALSRANPPSTVPLSTPLCSTILVAASAAACGDGATVLSAPPETMLNELTEMQFSDTCRELTEAETATIRTARQNQVCAAFAAIFSESRDECEEFEAMCNARSDILSELEPSDYCEDLTRSDLEECSGGTVRDLENCYNAMARAQTEFVRQTTCSDAERVSESDFDRLAGEGIPECEPVKESCSILLD